MMDVDGMSLKWVFRHSTFHFIPFPLDSVLVTPAPVLKMKSKEIVTSREQKARKVVRSEIKGLGRKGINVGKPIQERKLASLFCCQIFEQPVTFDPHENSEVSEVAAQSLG